MNGPDLGWDVAVPAGAELGERPFWDAGQACLMWVDITAGRLHRYRPGAGDEIVLDLSGEALGAAAPRRGGGYVLATAAGFRLTGSLGRVAGSRLAKCSSNKVRYAPRGCPPTPGSTTVRATPRGGSGPAR